MDEQQQKQPAIRQKSGPTADRTRDGRFAPGCSGNPSGRPRRLEVEAQALRDMCTLTPTAVDVLRQILESETVKPELKIRAAEIILDRVCGKAPSRDELQFEDIDAHNIGAYLQLKRQQQNELWENE